MLGILCGLLSEAKIAYGIPDTQVACAGAVPWKARALAKQLVEAGATRIMSFGLAGALDPSLPVGSLVVGKKVVTDKGKWDCDAVWADKLLKALPAAHCCDVWGSEVLVATAAEKIGLYQTNDCSAVDMESQCAAEIAAEAKLPLAVVRVVCDRADHNVPMLVMSAINADGSTNYAKVVSGLLRHPLQTIDLINVGRSMAKAMRVLQDTAEKIK